MQDLRGRGHGLCISHLPIAGTKCPVPDPAGKEERFILAVSFQRVQSIVCVSKAEWRGSKHGGGELLTRWQPGSGERGGPGERPAPQRHRPPQ